MSALWQCIYLSEVLMFCLSVLLFSSLLVCAQQSGIMPISRALRADEHANLANQDSRFSIGLGRFLPLHFRNPGVQIDVNSAISTHEPGQQAAATFQQFEESAAGGAIGPVFTYVKTYPHGNFKWGAKHFVGKDYRGWKEH